MHGSCNNAARKQERTPDPDPTSTQTRGLKNENINEGRLSHSFSSYLSLLIKFISFSSASINKKESSDGS